eukprot:1161124_1
MISSSLVHIHKRNFYGTNSIIYSTKDEKYSSFMIENPSTKSNHWISGSVHVLYNNTVTFRDYGLFDLKKHHGNFKDRQLQTAIIVRCAPMSTIIIRAIMDTDPNEASARALWTTPSG